MKKTTLTLTLLMACTKLLAQMWAPLPNQDINFGDGGCIKTMTTYNGNLIVGGSFTTDTNADFDRVAQYNGNQWTDVGGGIHNDINLFYGSDVVFLDTANNQLIAGGNFWTSQLSYFIKYTGQSWSRFNDTIFTARPATSYQYQDRLYLGGGGFSHLSDVNSDSPIAYIDTSGLNPIPAYIGSDGPFPFDQGIHAIAYYNGAMYFAGQFDYIDSHVIEFANPSVEHHHIASWDGENFTDVGGGLDGDVKSMEVYNGELYVSGNFYTAGGVSMPPFVKWNGTNWSPAVTTDGYPISQISPNDMMVYDNKLFIGSSFFSPENNLANAMTFDGTHWQPLASSMNGEVNAFYLHNNELLMAGCFTQIDGIACNHIARYTIPLGNKPTPNKLNISLYPNPAQHTLYLNNPSKQALSICLFNPLGQLVRTQQTKQNTTIDISNLPNGLYTAQINTTDGTQTIKVLKQ